MRSKNKYITPVLFHTSSLGGGFFIAAPRHDASLQSAVGNNNFVLNIGFDCESYGTHNIKSAYTVTVSESVHILTVVTEGSDGSFIAACQDAPISVSVYTRDKVQCTEMQGWFLEPVSTQGDLERVQRQANCSFVFKSNVIERVFWRSSFSDVARLLHSPACPVAVRSGNRLPAGAALRFVSARLMLATVRFPKMKTAFKTKPPEYILTHNTVLVLPHRLACRSKLFVNKMFGCYSPLSDMFFR